jgi:four helix bundle protein
MATNHSYRDLRIWQEAVDLALVIYRVTAKFPKHELYGLTSQMRRAAVSISSNIAEGKGHSSDGDFARFLFHSRGSLLELQTQIVIAKKLDYLAKDEAEKLVCVTDDLGRRLNGLIQAVRGKNSSRAAANSE